MPECIASLSTSRVPGASEVEDVARPLLHLTTHVLHLLELLPPNLLVLSAANGVAR